MSSTHKPVIVKIKACGSYYTKIDNMHIGTILNVTAQTLHSRSYREAIV